MVSNFQRLHLYIRLKCKQDVLVLIWKFHYKESTPSLDIQKTELTFDDLSITFHVCLAVLKAILIEYFGSSILPLKYQLCTPQK